MQINKTLEIIFNRYSCRSFTDKMPDDKDIELIAKAAVAAPSAMDRQPWRCIAVKNKRLIDDMEIEGMDVLKSAEDKSGYNRIMERGGKLFYNAPLMFIIPIAAGSQLDCGIICQNITIAAESLGLGTLICGLAGLAFSGSKAEEFKTRLDFPPEYQFGIAVLAGYKNMDKAPHTPDMGKIAIIN